MSDDTSKLLKACVEYRAMVDKLEAENAELREALSDDACREIMRLRSENAALWELTDAVESVVCDCEGAVAHIFEREPGDKWRVQVALDRARQLRATIPITKDLK